MFSDQKKLTQKSQIVLKASELVPYSLLPRWNSRRFHSPTWTHSQMGHSLQILCKLCPYILMYSALHIMQWFSHILDVFTPKIKRKFFDFYILWIKTNVAYTRLELIARTKYCTTTTASNWFVTLYYKLLPAVRSSSKHGRRRSSLLLYSISMIVLCGRDGQCLDLRQGNLLDLSYVIFHHLN